MQLSFLLYVSVTLGGLLVNAAPLPSETADAVSAPPPTVPSTSDHDLNDLINVLQARKSTLGGLGSLLGKPKPKPAAPAKVPPKPAAPAKPAPAPAAAPPTAAPPAVAPPVVAPPAQTTAAKTTPPPAVAPPVVAPPAQTTAANTTPPPVVAPPVVAPPVAAPPAQTTAANTTPPPAVAPPVVAPPAQTTAANTTPPPAVAPPVVAPPAQTTAANTTPPPAVAPPANTPPASTTVSAASQTSAGVAATSSAAFCPIYAQADAQDISQRDLEKIYARAGEEFWFRWEDPSVANGGAILQLASRGGAKDFDDQAYKWISTKAAAVTRGSFPKRVPTIYVMPAGTAASLLAQAKKFEETSEAEQAADFVTKDNEPGDLGINGVATSEDGTLPLDLVRNKVIRTVVKVSAKGSQQFVTIKNGKTSSTASKPDQAILNKIGC